VYKDILVYLDPSPDAETRLKVAIDLARLHSARLIGLEACAPAAFDGGWFDRTSSLPDTFEAATKLAGVEGRYEAIDRWAAAGRHEYAHYADLIVASQPEFEARHLIAPGVPEDVLVSSGVPMLLCLTAGSSARSASAS
jgi:hypothetical protein